MMFIAGIVGKCSHNWLSYDRHHLRVTVCRADRNPHPLRSFIKPSGNGTVNEGYRVKMVGEAICPSIDCIHCQAMVYHLRCWHVIVTCTFGLLNRFLPKDDQGHWRTLNCLLEPVKRKPSTSQMYMSTNFENNPKSVLSLFVPLLLPTVVWAKRKDPTSPESEPVCCQATAIEVTNRLKSYSRQRSTRSLE